MQEITELLRILAGCPERVVFDSALELNAQPAAQRLYEGVCAGEYTSDADAASDVFPGASADPSLYLETWQLLRERLSQAIGRFVSHLEQQTDGQRVHIECQYLWLNIRILSGRNAAELALPLASHLLRIAETFDLTMLCMDIASYLRTQNCLRDHIGGVYIDADRKYFHCRQVVEAEFLAEKFYTDLVVRRTDNDADRAAFLETSKKHAQVLLPLMRQYNSGKLHLYGRLVGLLRCMAAQNYAKAMGWCDTAIRFFKKRPHHSCAALQVFYYQRLLFSIHLRDAEAGAFSARACLELFDSHALGRFKIIELHLLLLLHTRQYAAALELFDRATNDPQYAFLSGAIKRGWRVYGLYLQFLTGEKATTGNTAQTGYSHHGHVGLETAYEAALFLLLLREGRHEEARTMAAALENRAETQLVEAGAWRSRVFLLLLVQIPVGKFRRSAVQTLAAPHLELLKRTNMVLANQIQEMEVVPYEDLWELILVLLE